MRNKHGNQKSSRPIHRKKGNIFKKVNQCLGFEGEVKNPKSGPFLPWNEVVEDLRSLKLNFSLKRAIWKNENQGEIDENWQCKNALMVIRDYNASLHVVWQDTKEPDPRSNKHTKPVIKLKLMKTDSVEMLWWRRRQYLNPSATMGRWCTIEFPGWQWRFTMTSILWATWT